MGMEAIIKEAIILAGGLGTRLRSAVPDLPKCMAPVNGRPFIEKLIQYLKGQGVEQFIFALGYKNEVFLSFLQQHLNPSEYTLSVEWEPLGTGGAVQLACSMVTGEHVLVTNGDTLFTADLNMLTGLHINQKAACTLALKPMEDFDRYGAVELNENHIITSFREKQFFKQGLINGGMYALHINSLLEKELPEKFSFEKDFLEKFYREGNILGQVQDAYFIDIGIPADYERAQIELQ